MLSGIHSLDERHSLYVNITSVSGDKWRAMTSISTQLNSRSKGEGLFTNKNNRVTSSPKTQKKAARTAAASIRAAHRSFSSTFTSSKPPHPRCTHTTHTCTHPTSITKGPNLSHQQSAFMGPLNHFSCLQCLKKDVNYVCDKTSDNISKLLSKCKLKHMEGQRP